MKLNIKYTILLLSILNNNYNAFSQNILKTSTVVHDTIKGVAEDFRTSLFSPKKWSVKFNKSDTYDEGIDLRYRDFKDVKDSNINLYDAQAAIQSDYQSFYYHNNIYFNNNLDDLIDTLFFNFCKNDLPKYEDIYTHNLKFWYKSDVDFRVAIDEIHTLKNSDLYRFWPSVTFPDSLTKSLLFNSSNSSFIKCWNIQIKIQNMNNIKEKLLAFLYLGEQFEFNDNSFINDAFNLIKIFNNGGNALNRSNNLLVKSNEEISGNTTSRLVNNADSSDHKLLSIFKSRIIEKYDSYSDWIRFVSEYNRNHSLERSLDVILDSIKFKSKNQVLSPDKLDLIESYEVLGDYCIKHNRYQKALESYYNALIINNSKDFNKQGNLELKIADLLNIYDVDKGYCSNDKSLSHYQIAGKYFSSRNKYLAKISNYKEATVLVNTITKLNSDGISQLRRFFEISIDGLIDAWENKLTYQQKYYLYKSLGNYFETKETIKDYKTARIYYQNCAIALLLSQNEYKSADILDILDRLIFINYYLNNIQKMLHFHDLKLKLGKKMNDNYHGDWILFENSPKYTSRSLSVHCTYLQGPKGSDKFYPIKLYSSDRYNYIESQIYYKLWGLDFDKNKESQALADYYGRHPGGVNSISGKTDENEETIALDYLESFYTNTSLKKDFENLFSDFDTLKLDFENARAKNSNLIEENKMLFQKYLKFSLQNKNLDSKNRNLEDKNDTLKSINDTLISDNDNIKNQNFTLKQINVDIGEQIDSKNQMLNLLKWTTYLIVIILLVILSFSSIFYRRLKKKKEKLQNITYQSDLHSAISRVLTRCLSHNIGSHVLSKFLDKEQVTILDAENQYIPFFPNRIEQAELLANFNEYLKYRMDYLADIATTSEPVMESPMYLVRDIIKGFDKNRILLNRISGVSSDKQFGLKVFCNGMEITDDNNPSDPLLSVTNDILGAQAFYIILENIIRNIYKHGNPSGTFDIVINVNHSEMDQSFYDVCIYDTIYKSKSSIDAIVEKRNTTFNDSVLHDNKLRDSNLGSIEMAVSASYLRCLPIDSCNEERFRKIDIQADSEIVANPANRLIYAYNHRHIDFASDNSNENCYALGYRFFISKPRQVLVVSKSEFRLSGDHENLKNKGILVVNPNDIDSKFVSNHQFIYFDDGVTDNITDKYPSQFPKRKVSFDESIKTDTVENFIASLWSRYSKERFSKFNRISFKNGKREPSLAFSSDPENGAEYKVFIDNHDKRWGCRNCFEITSQCSNEDLKTSMSSEGDTSQKKIGLITRVSQTTNNICEPLGKYDFYDMACSHSKIFKLLRSGLLDNPKLQNEYAENVFTGIIVIDERIQQNIAFEPRRTYSGRMPFLEYFQQQKIFIPLKEEANLNTESFGQLNDNQQIDIPTEAEKIRSYIQSHIEDATFCIIHLGILEKMLPSGNDKTFDKVDSVIKKLLPDPDQRKKLVITSGRGGALNIPTDLSYIPLALLQNALETLFDKFVLTKILFNSRICK